MTVVNEIANIIEAGIDQNGYATLIVSGGSSLLKIFAELTKVTLDWDKVTISLVDDRLVSEQSLDSNELLIKSKLIINKAKAARFIPLNKSNLKQIFNLLPFDLIVLGMGSDGHFASIFPDMLKQKEFVSLNAKPAIYNVSSRGTPYVPRITMNLALILRSQNIFLVVSDDRKKAILDRAQIDEKYPVHFLVNQKKILVRVIEPYEE